MYKKILLKLSGEALAGEQQMGIESSILEYITSQIKTLCDLGIRLGIVIGGGNFWRGRSAAGYDRVSADSIGMMATIMNALALRDFFNRKSIPTKAMSAVPVERVIEPITVSIAREYLDAGNVVIFAGGTGLPFVSTDTAAALRALDIQADALLKATLVDGVYDRDPHKYQDAVKYDTILYRDVISKNLKVMDLAAISLCMEHNMPIHVFNMSVSGNMADVVQGKSVGTLIKGE